MKILISHDVDHMTVWEHAKKDLVLPKFIVRAFLELFKGKISFIEFLNRFGDFFSNQWQRVEEVMNFNESRGIKSTFFIGVNNGVGLSYPLKYVEKWVPVIHQRNFEVGVHGIDFDSFEKVKKEHETFKRIFKKESFGIRMHYLRANEHTFSYIEQSGYAYETTTQGFKNPFKTGEMWNFPLQIMDGWAIEGEKRYQSRDLEEAKKYTLAQIEKAKEAGLTHLSILFHDRYFSSSFKTWKDWYMWIIDHLLAEGYEFTTHEEAIKTLEQQ